ncbi:substrate-binding domain-containing protein [Paenibacillus sp. BSR1-1]|uniref:substrate-binding domain-containing protein n=1 Tax=Paenibacillus sp. BSR1-1 TaxID=3020845 RepID=UPI0025B123A0|nr:substrate-binding domain-containing protein [Paenibacillus sp. BSR1-1]MDN3019402.1 substrate-binding domain-containing protein [Paenibacillus sp. BSR1-1]
MDLNLYKEVLRTMSECVIIHEKSGNMVALNDNVEKVLGFSEELLTESTLRQFEFFREDGTRLPYSELPNILTLEQGIPFKDFIVGGKDLNHNLKWLSINSTPLKMDGGQAALVTISDITERRKMEHALLQAKEEAEKANMAKSDFLSKMSHELRTPLNGILGFAQLLEIDATLNEEQQDFVQEILGGGNHLLSLINDILDLSRIETGQLKVTIEEVNLLTIINECIKIVQPLAQKKEISLHNRVNPSQSIVVLADAIRLKQILLNLLDNAIKYNRIGGKVIIHSYLKGNEAFVHVVDTGAGISADEYQKVFVPFYRVEGTQEEGTGIGLSMVKQLVHQMGGSINVTSQKRIGSNFSFSLPLSHDLKAAVRWGENIESHVVNENKTEQYCLLYIEDNESNLNLVTNIMKSQPSYTFLSARTGKEGLEMAAKEKVDLILLDLDLPDIHGNEVFERLKSCGKTKDIAIIAVSANAIPQDIQYTLDLGFDNYVTKPFNVQEFLSVIKETLLNTINQNIPADKILSQGPHGEEAVSAKTLQLSLKDLRKLKEKKYKAAIAMHYTENDFSTATINGLKDTFEKMGIEVVAVSDAEFKANKQISDIETIIELKADVIVSLPVNPHTTAPVFKKASKAGIKLIFMDSMPEGLEAGKDYVSVVTSDNYGNGIFAGEIMGDALNGAGKIGVIFHNADFFVNNQRVEAFETTIKENYPNIKIAARAGITTPKEAEKAASDMLATSPDLDGIFAIWDQPAEGVLAAARKAGKNDIVITTVDLGSNVAIDIASDGNIKGLGAQLPYENGVAQAIIAGYSLLGKEVAPFYVVPAMKVTKENVLKVWKLAYRQDAPNAIEKYF